MITGLVPLALFLLRWSWVSTASVWAAMAQVQVENDAHRMSKKNWFNVVILGAGFFLLFSAFQTSAFVQVK